MTRTLSHDAQNQYLAVRESDYFPPKPASRFRPLRNAALGLLGAFWKTRLGVWALHNLWPIPVELNLRYGLGAETWLIEFEDGTAIREVGLNDRGQPICSGNTFGVFAGEVGLEDLADVAHEAIPAEVFESAWERARRDSR